MIAFVILVVAVGCARPSPEAARVAAVSADEGQLFEALRTRPPGPDPWLERRFARWFDERPDEHWLASQLLAYGAEPLWPSAVLEERRQRAILGPWGPIRGVLGFTAERRPIEAYWVAGETEARALVIAGVHGSEVSGIEVVEALVDALRDGERPAYSAIVVPALFPDHAAVRLREEPGAPTNRNFPPPGTSVGASASLDALGRPILPENLLLLALVDRFRPTRIASVHATTRAGASGVFSDPHAADVERTAEDEGLAIEMARHVAGAGFPASVVGNDLEGAPSARWSGGVDGGTSLGGWGPCPVAEGGPSDRPSLTAITVEVDGPDRSDDFAGEAATARKAELAAVADALRVVFLGGSPR